MARNVVEDGDLEEVEQGDKISDDGLDWSFTLRSDEYEERVFNDALKFGRCLDGSRDAEYTLISDGNVILVARRLRDRPSYWTVRHVGSEIVPISFDGKTLTTEHLHALGERRGGDELTAVDGDCITIRSDYSVVSDYEDNTAEYRVE